MAVIGAVHFHLGEVERDQRAALLAGGAVVGERPSIEGEPQLVAVRADGREPEPQVRGAALDQPLPKLAFDLLDLSASRRARNVLHL